MIIVYIIYTVAKIMGGGGGGGGGRFPTPLYETLHSVKITLTQLSYSFMHVHIAKYILITHQLQLAIFSMAA